MDVIITWMQFVIFPLSIVMTRVHVHFGGWWVRRGVHHSSSFNFFSTFCNYQSKSLDRSHTKSKFSFLSKVHYTALNNLMVVINPPQTYSQVKARVKPVAGCVSTNQPLLHLVTFRTWSYPVNDRIHTGSTDTAKNQLNFMIELMKVIKEVTFNVNPVFSQLKSKEINTLNFICVF